MKKLYPILLFSLFLLNKSTAQYYFQYFDGADTSYSNSIMILIENDSTNIWQIGQPQKNIFDTAATIPNVLVTDTINFYPNNNISRFILEMEKTWPFGIFALQWKQKLDLDNDNDGGIVEYTMDDGLTWQNCFNSPYVYNFYGFNPSNQDTLNTGEYAFSGTDTTWRDIWLCFDLSWMTTTPDTIMLRFTLKTDSINTNKEGWMIDNFMGHITMIHTVNEIEHANYLSTFPNPTNDIVNIDIKKINGYHIIEEMDLINLSGKIVKHWENIPTKFWFSTKDYENGTYILRVKTNVQTQSTQIIIQNK